MQHIYRVFGLFMSVLGLIPVVSLASLPNELPKALAENLKSPQSHVVIRYDWPVLMSDPLFVEFLDLYSNENETDIPHLEILWGSAAQSVTRSRLDPTIIDSAWVTMHSLSAKHSATFWALTTLPTDVLRQKLNTSGLVATPDNEHVFGPVPDEQADPDDYRRYTSADPEQQEVLLKRFMQWKWRILILDGGCTSARPNENVIQCRRRRSPKGGVRLSPRTAPRQDTTTLLESRFRWAWHPIQLHIFSIEGWHRLQPRL